MDNNSLKAWFETDLKNLPDVDVEDLLKKCESPIEKYFAEEIYKFLGKGIKCEGQVKYTAKNNNYRVDFVLSDGVNNIGVECDGKDFHDFMDDEERDYDLISDNCLQCIYRFRGTDLVNYLEICIFQMSKDHPYLFSDRGRKILLSYFKNWKNPLTFDITGSILDRVLFHEDDDSYKFPRSIDIIRRDGEEGWFKRFRPLRNKKEIK